MSYEATSAGKLGPPLLRLVRGSADGSDVTVEIAALVAVLAARSSSQAEQPTPASTWARPATRLRRPLAVGVGGWRRSGLPV